VAAITPVHDVERFGIKLHGSPRPADILTVTDRAEQIAHSLRGSMTRCPRPKFDVALERAP
jgi:Ni,Fe-hydrogenase III small subunit